MNTLKPTPGNVAMKHISIIFLTLLWGAYIPVTAKETNPVDSSEVKCTYKFTFLRDTTQMRFVEDLYVVQIGKKITKGYCYKTFYIDSLHNTPDGVDKLTTKLNEQLKNNPNLSPSHIENAVGMLSRGHFQFYLYKDYQHEKIIVSDNVSAHFFHYEDELKPQDWIILEDTITILGYTCQKATCSFRGRDWTAWFASDIPISEGSLKFQGLPGLIMKINDSRSHYCFELEGLQQVKEPIFMDIKKTSQKTERKTFLKMLMGTGGEKMMEIDMAKVGISNDFKKKEYDYFESDYND